MNGATNKPWNAPEPAGRIFYAMNKAWLILLMLLWVRTPGSTQAPLLLADSSFRFHPPTGAWQLDDFRDYQYDEQGTLARRRQWEPIPGFSTQRLLRSQTNWDTLPAQNTWEQERNQFFYTAPPALTLRTQISQRLEKKYNASNQLESFLDRVQLQDWETDSLQGSAARFLYSYQPDGCLSRRLRQSSTFNQLNADMPPWNPVDEELYEYEQGCLPARVYRNTWDGTLQAWIPAQESRYTYHENGKLQVHLALSPAADTLYTETWQYNTFDEPFLYDVQLADGSAVQDRYEYGNGGALQRVGRYERPAPDSAWLLQWERSFNFNTFLETELFQVFRNGDPAAVLTRELDARHLNAEGQVARAEYLLEVYNEADLQLRVLRHYEAEYTYPCAGLPASTRSLRWLGYVSQGLAQALPPDERESFGYDVSIDCEARALPDGMLLFPNPSSGQVRLYSEHLRAGSQIRLLDMQGRQLYAYQATSDWVEELLLPDLVSGMYVLQLERAASPPLASRLIILIP